MTEERKTSSLFNRADADVIFRSCDGADFRLHKLILSIASPFFAEMFTLPSAPDADQNAGKQGDPQVVEMVESAMTLESLFSFCYPMERSQFEELSPLRAVLQAAIKYDMAFVSRPLMEDLRLFLPSEPLRVYAIAYLMEDAGLALEAAKRLLDDPLFYDPRDPPPELAQIPATALTCLAKYRRECAEAARTIFLDHTWMYSTSSGHPVVVSRKGNADTSNAWVWLACASCERAHGSLAIPNVSNGVHAYVWPRAWWQTYFDAVAAVLCLRPLGSVLTKRKLLDIALAKAGECQTCGPRAARELGAYREAMAKRVDDATEMVVLELPF
ncbi:hypothetical protein BV20DRAFT_1033407 [Pilatotrama ljubarskyi]|nr:hypothetical protein BV20DRAFT_1033407 [Pilatotrama ljubarskyi]